ncbi:MAG: prepilin-type N-terminal cleavage/methylation domain-containing protein [Patescibacteria group bacterium]
MYINSTKRGFTLIELLVVIAIIGILSSVVLASLNTARLKSRDARRFSDIKQLQIALALYSDSNSSAYPTTLTALQPTYISVVPTDPVGNAAYRYSALGTGATCSSYHLGATLEETTNQGLSGDIDAAAGSACTGSSADFAGTDPIYDVKP